MDRATFEVIESCYGDVASWAIWNMDNIANLDVLDIEKDEKLLTKLNPQIVLLGLNISGDLDERRFSNFHVAGAQGSRHLRKLRYALYGSVLWGAYMTDIIKEYPQSNSGKVKVDLDTCPEILENNFSKFHKEIESLGVENPTIVAFGGTTYGYLKKYIRRYPESKCKTMQIVHYSAVGLTCKGGPSYSDEGVYKEKIQATIAESRHLL
ncbi:hypothetical protein M1N56_06340 [Dehalococcoidia bacterium]|nr:hypothetical protein [Dehalococcoidia bacterium]